MRHRTNTESTAMELGIVDGGGGSGCAFQTCANFFVCVQIKHRYCIHYVCVLYYVYCSGLGIPKKRSYFLFSLDNTFIIEGIYYNIDVRQNNKIQ